MVWKPNNVSYQRTTHVPRICITTLLGTKVMLFFNYIFSKSSFIATKINGVFFFQVETSTKQEMLQRIGHMLLKCFLAGNICTVHHKDCLLLLQVTYLFHTGVGNSLRLTTAL